MPQWHEPEGAMGTSLSGETVELLVSCLMQLAGLPSWWLPGAFTLII